MKKRVIVMLLNFLEVESNEEANKVDLEIYSFIKFSDTRNCYIFKRRARK